MAIPENLNKTSILLESGTNELEIIEFTVANEIFGINVAKVREIMVAKDVKVMPNSHPVVEGVFKPRDEIITVIDLAKYLNLPECDSERDIFIVTHFNKLNFAFHVHSVIGIDRISWTAIKKPDRAVYGGQDGAATGIAEYQGRLITILDFEKIVADISPESSIQVESIAKLGERHTMEKPILIAEDSMLLSKMIIESLHKAGYKNTIKTDNGQEAWDYLREAKESGDPIKEHVACIVSDIEMPLMDGHRLTKLVKEDPVLRSIPLILFSSLISEEMRIKGRQLGADEQISKPEISKLVSIIDHLTGDH
ncbi:chemotaxis protein [Clostridium aminobutyricum]|uniref:Stage 0 sporulation protein A homolog n=1 Tax=Clostridium aminobutyricum TaxID=33953 RepID=A0A939D698_CLOAM|nr:chemotaxis protein [Clostridium aminobutyricum]MBN7771992.1 chemotaxis protein CheV [Clostridium aminobutyricum]